MLSLPEDPTKAQEIEFINTVYLSIPINSYLNQLFTSDFIHWIETSIKDDWNLNFYKWYEDEQRENADLKTQRDQLENDLTALKERYESLAAAMTEAKTKHTAAIAEAQASHDRLFIRTNEAEELNERQAKTITELKAKLYDLMNE